MSGPRQFTWRLGAILIGLTGSLIAGEVAFHVFGIEPPQAPPADQIDAFKVSNALNSLGLREPEGFPRPRQPNELRIAVLGDSMTYGEGVEAEEALPAALATALRSFSPSPVQSENLIVVNMGKLGDDTDDELRRFKLLQDTIDPDLVILVMYVNDFAGAGAPEAALHEIYEVRDGLSWPSQYSRLFEYAERKIRIRAAFEKTIARFRADAEGGVKPEALRPVAAAVAELSSVCRSRGCRLVVCMMPWLVRLDDYPLKKMHAAVANMCKDAGIPFCDLLPAVEGQPAASMRVSRGNHHPSVAAHQRIAAYLARWLVREDMLAAGPN